MEGEVFGPYRLDALIGSGGMGEVFRAYDTGRNRVVALKRLPRQLAVDDEYRARFQRESALVAQLREPHIIPIHDYGEIDGQLYIDMRLVEGSDVAKVLTRGPMTVSRAIDVTSQIADALDAAHAEGLVHRDVKPSNILLVGRSGSGGVTVTDRGVAYLVDFGIARAVDGPTLSQAGLAMGSSGYMAPERLTGDHWDLRVDVYSLTCVLYECLVGTRPFPAKSLPAAINAHLNTPPPRPSDGRPDMPAGLDQVIATGMAKNPDERFASAGQLAFAARSLLTRTGSAPVPVPGPRPTPGPRPDTGPRPHSGPHPGGPLTGPPYGGPRPATGPGPGGPPPYPTGPGGPQPYRPGSAPAAVISGPVRTGDSSGPIGGPIGPAQDPVRPGTGRRKLLIGAAATAALAVTGGAVWGGLRLAGLIGAAGPWTFETGDKVYSSPTVADGVVYIGSNDGVLYALDAGTGTEVWRYPTRGPVTSSPTVVGGVVYVGSNDEQVHAVDAATGKVRWTSPAAGVVHSSPTVATGTVFVGSRDGSLQAFAADSGEPRWRFAGGNWFNSSPAVAGGAVFVGCRDNNIYAVDAATGAERWRFATTSTVDSSPTVDGDRVYIGADDYRVRCLDAGTGALNWEFWAEAGVVSGPVLDDGVVYVGSDDANLYALEADTGRQRWNYTTGGGIRSSPAVSGELVYVGSQDRSLHAVDLRTGAARWRYETPGPLDDSSPAVANGLVYIGSLSNAVFAVDAETGEGPPA